MNDDWSILKALIMIKNYADYYFNLKLSLHISVAHPAYCFTKLYVILMGLVICKIHRSRT